MGMATSGSVTPSLFRKLFLGSQYDLHVVDHTPFAPQDGITVRNEISERLCILGRGGVEIHELSHTLSGALSDASDATMLP
jgi:hypothetical protein